MTASAVSAGNEILIACQRHPSRADRAKQDLVLLERRRLEHDANAIGQRPFGDAHRLVGRRGGDGSGRGCASRAMAVARRVDVCRQPLGADAADHASKLHLVGQGRLVALGRRDRDDPVANRASSPWPRALTSASVISGENRWFKPYS